MVLGRTGAASWIIWVWILFGAGSLAAVITGCWTAAADGAPVQAWGPNLMAWGLGALVAAGLARLEVDMALGWLALATTGLAFTLLTPGPSGVHRWIGVGPVRLNAAELVLPVALAACGGLGRASLWRLLAPLPILLILAAQPDLSQATATAGASLTILATSDRAFRVKALVAAGSLAAVVVAALRPDRLSPVAHVEGIVRLAFAHAPAIAALGMAGVLLAVLAPLSLARAREPRVRDGAVALTTYAALAALAPAAGAFPVPLMGLGVSPVLGAWVGLGWMMHLARPSGQGLKAGTAPPMTNPRRNPGGSIPSSGRVTHSDPLRISLKPRCCGPSPRGLAASRRGAPHPQSIT